MQQWNKQTKNLLFPCTRISKAPAGLTDLVARNPFTSLGSSHLPFACRAMVHWQSGPNVHETRCLVLTSYICSTMETWLPRCWSERSRGSFHLSLLGCPLLLLVWGSGGPWQASQGLGSRQGAVRPPGSIFHTVRMALLGFRCTQLHQPTAGWDT